MKQKIISIAVSLLFAPLVYAETKNNAIQLDSVAVIGKHELLNIDRSLAGSVDVITRDELEYEHVTDTLELYTKAPGVVLSRYNQGIINTDISIRGFAGDGSTPHAKLLVDGIPSNLHNGYNEMDYLFPTNIQSIQVFKGTSDPASGVFATAGNYKVETRKDNGKQLQASFGSFDTKELQGYFGDKQGDLTQNYALGYRAGKGYRDHTDIEKIALSARWQYDFEKSSLALSTKYGKYNAFEAPGYLSKDEARRNPRRSADFANQDDGEKEFKHISLHYDYFFNEDTDLSLKAYSQGFERERNVRFSASQLLVENRFDDQNMQGIIAKLNWRINQNWTLQTGYDIEKQKVLEQRFRGTQTRRDFDFDFETQGAFVQLENTPTNWLRWNVALRADRLDGDVNRAFVVNGAATNRRMFDFGTIMQPKLNVFANITDTQTVFANYGRSFQHPFGGDAFTTGNKNARDVAINDGWELGLKSNWAKLNTRVSYWQQDAQDEFVVIDGTGQNVGETERKGLDASFDITFNEQWSIWGNVSKVFTEITNASTANQNFTGNDLRGIPDHTASVGLQYTYSDKLVARVHVDRQGAYYLNEANIGGKYGAYTLTHANVDYKTSWGTVSLQANNIFNKFYEYVFDQNLISSVVDSIHSPGAGRNFTLSATMDF
ncbi:MAG: TonB-dependent receptor [Methylotenera sp.]|nr:TonB-dependent receptor [Methylotenera sp.]MDO9388432.1 TonB-dependent receptor [Methylotenera sp.]